MKPLIFLIAIAILVWVFWMTFEWLRNPYKNVRKRRKHKNQN
jgi:uncharacterized membrane protein